MVLFQAWFLSLTILHVTAQSPTLTDSRALNVPARVCQTCGCFSGCLAGSSTAGSNPCLGSPLGAACPVRALAGLPRVCGMGAAPAGLEMRLSSTPPGPKFSCRSETQHKCLRASTTSSHGENALMQGAEFQEAAD